MKLRNKALAATTAALVVLGGGITAAHAAGTDGTGQKTVAVGAIITVNNNVPLVGGKTCEVLGAVWNSGPEELTFTVDAVANEAVATSATTLIGTHTITVTCKDMTPGGKTYTTVWTVDVKDVATVTITGLAATYNLSDANTAVLASTVTPEGNDGAVTYSVADTAGTPGCSIDGSNQVAFTAVGVCTVTADLAETASYSAATTTTTFTIVDTPTVTFSAPTADYFLVADSGAEATTLVAAVSAGAGAITYSVKNAGTTGCTISGGSSDRVSFTGVGTCVVTATSAADEGAYQLSSSADLSIAVHDDRTVSVTSSSFRLNQSGSAALTATPSIGAGDISYEVTDAGTANCAETSEGVLTFDSVGSCKVTATVVANGLYEAATSSETTITIRPTLTAYVVTITGYAPKATGKALGVARAKAVRTFLYNNGLQGNDDVTVSFVAKGKTLTGAGLNTRRAVVTISWSGATSGRVTTTVFFPSRSTVARPARANLRIALAATDLV